MFADERKEILDFYSGGVEGGRLISGIGQIELARTREILSRVLPPPPAIIYDVGGGTGVYSFWLAAKGYQVHLLDLCPENIAIAQANAQQHESHPLASITVVDALHLHQTDESADVMLLMGPLYHLMEKMQRLQALHEARRVLKPGGLLAAATINRFANFNWGLSVYSKKERYLEEPAFWQMAVRELEEGQHFRPPEYPSFLARAYFHSPKEIQAEVEEAGFVVNQVLAVEGSSWIVPDINEHWAEVRSRETILNVVRLLEDEDSIKGFSPHLLTIAHK